MRANLFWLHDKQWLKIEPLIPMHRPDRNPRNNRRILSRIIDLLNTRCRWQHGPPGYGSYRRLYNRFNRRSGHGIWRQIFATVAQSPEPPQQATLDSTHVKAHRCADGGKGPRNRRSVSPSGRNSRIHRLADKLCRPWVLILTPATPPTAPSGQRAWLTASRNCLATKPTTATGSASQ